MGTSAFDREWDATPPAKPKSAFDAAWDAAPTRRPKTPAQLERLRQNAAEQNAAEQVGARDYLGDFLETLMTPAAGIPGFKLGASKIRSLLSSEPMAVAQREVNETTSDIPYASALGRGIGIVSAARLLPASGLASGAILGGAEGALTNEPGVTNGGRVARGVGGAVVGGLLGGAVDKGVTAVRTALTPAADVAKLTMLSDRAKEAKVLYDRARAEGQGATMPPAIKYWLDSPDIATIVTDLKASRTHMNTPVYSAEMLDAVYKVLSDQQGIAQSRLAALVPRNANLGRLAANDLKLAKEEGLDAISRGPGAPMPTYEEAVRDFARRTREMESFGEGYNLLRNRMGGGLPGFEKLNRPGRSFGAFDDWLSGVQSSARDAEMAGQGVLSGARQVARDRGILSSEARRANAQATQLLRQTDRASNTIVPSAVRRGLFAGLLADWQ